MFLNLNSSRQRAISRRALLIFAIALLLALACLMLPTMPWNSGERGEEARMAGAPPEAATRPNPPTVPVRGAVDEPESE